MSTTVTVQQSSGAADLFGALDAGRNRAALSQRSAATAEEAMSVRPVGFLTAAPEVPVSVASLSPGPQSSAVVSPPQRRPLALAADRSARRKPASVDDALSVRKSRPSVIVSERVAVPEAPVRHVSRRAPSPESVSVSSASDLSDMEPRKRHRRSRQHRRVSSRHHHKSSRRPRSVSSSSSSSRSSARHSRRRHHHRTPAPPPPAPAPVVVPPVVVEQDTGDCGRCTKPRFVDPLDPSIAGLSEKKKERIRNEIITRIQSLQRRYKSEDIRLPERGIDDPVICFRRYRRITRHLYGKQKINSYRLIVFIFTLIVQVALSILCGPAAADYLKNEYAEISKYDSVFYEMGCRSYSPYGEAQSPESRFAWQLVTPIFLIGVTYFITRYTAVPRMAVDLFTGMASAYLKSETAEYRTLLHDDEIDENDENSDDDETPVATAAKPIRPRREPTIRIPNLEDDLPGDSAFPAAVQAAVPRLVNMITSLRAQPEGAQPVDAGGFMGTMMGLAKAFMGDRMPAAAGAPPPRKPEPSVIVPAPRPPASDLVAYAD